MNNKQPDDHNSQDPACSYPSGNGSLHGPCSVHPPKSNFVFMSGDRNALRPDLGDRRFMSLEVGNESAPAATSLADMFAAERDTEKL